MKESASRNINEKMPGLAQWFAFEDYAEVEQAVRALKELRITEFRTLFSWADWMREGGEAWFDWFVGKLAEVPNIRLLPCIFYTPSQLSMQDADGKRKTSYPPEDASAYAEFVEVMIKKYGKHFDWVQIWNEPNWKPYWDESLDPDWSIYADMARQAAAAAHAHKKKVALGGVTPLEIQWFTRMEEKGLLRHIDAVCFHFAPSWPLQHRRWFPIETEMHSLRALLAGLGRNCEVWMDESGISTNTPEDHDEQKLEQEQIRFFDMLAKVSADRTYWFCLFDQKTGTLTDDMINTGKEIDTTAFHFGILRTDGTKKPLYEHWKELAHPGRSVKSKRS
ncbi:MAG: NAD-dependent epimerase/dehydratase [Candidatus Taylorbacteria bacterium]|nr:NAD-dependent epimerase/dehydratase [Candidatus Taylorbacteria bacterium]